jgi:glutathione S-transferase
MKLYDGMGPNPAVVRMFIAERGVGPIESELIDQRAGDNRREPFLSVNPTGTVPALALDDGTVIAEITAICEYLDEVADGPSLIGATPAERAVTRMWTRRVSLNICEPLVSGWRYGPGEPMFRDRIRCMPEASAGLLQVAHDGYAWLERQMADGRPFIAGNRLTLADILLFGFVTFGEIVGQPIAAENGRLHAWQARMQARPSAAVA